MKKQETNKKEIFNSCVYLRLNIITNLTNILTFSLSFENYLSAEIESFINASILYLFEFKSMKKPIYLILDNSPKNRSKSMFQLADNNRVRFVYTTPTTPQHNFAESVFCLLKKSMSKYNFKSRYV